MDVTEVHFTAYIAGLPRPLHFMLDLMDMDKDDETKLGAAYSFLDDEVRKGGTVYDNRSVPHRFGKDFNIIAICINRDLH